MNRADANDIYNNPYALGLPLLRSMLTSLDPQSYRIRHIAQRNGAP